MNLSSELNQSCEELRLFGQQELSDNADLGLRYFVLGCNIVLIPFSLSLSIGLTKSAFLPVLLFFSAHTHFASHA